MFIQHRSYFIWMNECMILKNYGFYGNDYKICLINVITFFFIFFIFISLLKVTTYYLYTCTLCVSEVYQCNLKFDSINSIKKNHWTSRWKPTPIVWIWIILSVCTLGSQSQNSFNMVVQLHIQYLGWPL